MRSCCRTAVAIVVLVLVASIAQGYLKPYEIAPTRASWSSWTSWQEPNTWVGQTVTCCWDSMAEVHVFVGSLGASPQNAFDVEVAAYPGGGLPIAYAYNIQASKEHDWLKFPLTTEAGQKFVRGKEYIVRVTRPGDSVNYYWQESAGGGPYKYGHMVVGGVPQEGQDLAMRVYGVMRPVGPEYFGAYPYFPMGGETWGC